MPVSKVYFASIHSSWCGGSRERLLVVSILAFVQNKEILITSIIVKLVEKQNKIKLNLVTKFLLHTMYNFLKIVFSKYDFNPHYSMCTANMQ